VLAWTIREGATNVIRHSGAHHCTLRIRASLTDAGVEVLDDGAGAPDSADTLGAAEASDAHTNGTVNGTPRRGGAGGHGIAGLAERARLVNGTIESGALAGGGYRLAVTVPVSHA